MPLNYNDNDVPTLGGLLAVAAIALLALTACATKQGRREAALSWDGKSIFDRPAACDQTYAITDDLIWKEMTNQDTSDSSRKSLNKRVEAIISPQLGGGAEGRGERFAGRPGRS